ncbi:MAG: N-acetyltransferase, partial [Ruminococcaceae bacterium]|nr:N-acetyltransferase [Oscillospiraceae bacterium]
SLKYAYPKGPSGYKRTLVKTGATIGANATIVCGNELGEWCTIAAGAVVTKNVPAHALMAGVPARQIGWVCECGQVLNEDLECPDCHRRYNLVEGLLKENEE